MNSNCLLAVIFACVLCIGLPTGAMADETVVILATDYPPYEFEHSEDGKRGFDLEVVEEAMRRAGYTVEFRFYPWSRVMRMIRENEALAALSCSKTSERDTFIEYSSPISKLTEVLLVRKGFSGTIPNKYSDLGDIEVGTMIDWAFSERLKELGIPHDLSPDEKVGMRKLAEGRVEGLLMVLESTLYLAKKMEMADDFKWAQIEDHVFDFHLCFSKERPETPKLLRDFNEKLAEMKGDGSYEAIHARYK